MSNQQRPLNHAINLARDGSAKRTESVPIAHGMKNRSAPDASSALGTPEHAGMQPLCDAENFTTFDKRLTPVAPHPGTQSRAYDQRGGHVEGQADEILSDAASLGKRKPAQKA